MTTLALAPRNELSGLPGVLTPVSYQPGNLTFDEAATVWETLKTLHGGTMWWMGDFLNWAEGRFGELAAQLEDATGFAYQTQANAKSVASRVPARVRVESLSWTHHREVAALDPDEQRRLLSLADANGWTTRELHDEIATPSIGDRCTCPSCGSEHRRRA